MTARHDVQATASFRYSCRKKRFGDRPCGSAAAIPPYSMHHLKTGTIHADRACVVFASLRPAPARRSTQRANHGHARPGDKAVVGASCIGTAIVGHCVTNSMRGRERPLEFGWRCRARAGNCPGCPTKTVRGSSARGIGHPSVDGPSRRGIGARPGPARPAPAHRTGGALRFSLAEHGDHHERDALVGLGRKW